MPRTVTKLKPFEGKDVVESTIKITKTGDGLSSALEIEPMEIEVGERGYTIIEWECIDVQFPRLKTGSNQLRRKHVLETQRAMMTDGQEVVTALDKRDRELEAAAAEQRRQQAEQLSMEQEQGR